MTTPSTDSPASEPVMGDGPMLEEASGQDISLTFDAKRCIHARFCVLGAPQVFVANTPGEWLFPDRARPEHLVAVVENCPSGAVRYHRSDGGPQEQAPEVNLVRLREHGPLAVHAQVVLSLPSGAIDTGFRATLCRCGESKNKPYCDGSHNAAGFNATGEPACRESSALPVRDGELAIRLIENGPLHFEGPLELCTGTGRTIDRARSAYFCRCGHSKNKPFCDGSHGSAGFQAPGSPE